MKKLKKIKKALVEYKCRNTLDKTGNNISLYYLLETNEINLLAEHISKKLFKNKKTIDNILYKDFKECLECSTKPGSPELCETCLYNRDLVNELQNNLINIKRK